MHKLNQLEQAVLVIDDLQVLWRTAYQAKHPHLSTYYAKSARELQILFSHSRTILTGRTSKIHPIEGRLDIIKIEELDTATT